MKSISRLTLALVTGSVLAACTTFTPNTTVVPSDLEGEIWVLSTINNEGPVNGKRITLNFESNGSYEGKVNGRGPCNGYFGSYTLENSQIHFSPLASTMMGCRTPIMKQEQAFLGAFPKITHMTKDGQTLTLSSADKNQTLTFLPETGHLKGSITFTGAKLPAESQVFIRLQDTSRQDAPAINIGEQRIKLDKQTASPVSFDIAYAPHLIKDRHIYTLDVEIRNNGRLIYRNTSQTKADFSKAMSIQVDKTK